MTSAAQGDGERCPDAASADYADIQPGRVLGAWLAAVTARRGACAHRPPVIIC